MLREVIASTPPELWDDDAYENRTWRLAYHTLWGVRFYLGAHPGEYEPFDGAIEQAESLGAAWEDSSEAPPVERAHTRDELLAYVDALLAHIPDAVASIPFDAPSGFEWYPMSRFELHLNTIRHIQHHTGQLIERLRDNGVTGFDWQ